MTQAVSVRLARKVYSQLEEGQGEVFDLVAYCWPHGSSASGLGHASVLTIKEITTFRVGGRVWTYLGCVSYRLTYPSRQLLIT